MTPSNQYDPNPPQPGVNLPPVPGAQPQQNQPQVDPRVARLEQELQEQRRLTNNLSTVLSRNVPQQNNGQNPSREDMQRQFYADPINSTQAIAAQAAREAVQQYGAGHMETLVATAREQARSSDPELFDRYIAEIEGNVALAGPQFAANTNVWKSAFNMAKGQHMNEIRDAARQQNPQAPAIHVSREGGPGVPNVPQGPAPRVAELNEDQKRTAKKLGITEDMYRQGIEYNDKQTDLDFNPLGPSSWDKVITFDSREKRRNERAAANRRNAAA